MMKATTVSVPAEVIPGRNQKSSACTKNITKKVALRVMTSEAQARNTRPRALPRLTTPTMPAATTALTRASSWKSGASCEITEMPAEVFRKRRNHSANHTITQIQPPQPMTGEASQEDSNSIQDATGQRDDARATTIQPEATEESRNPQCEDADGKR